MGTIVPDLIGQQDGTEIRFQLTDGRNVVGRAAECDLVLVHPTVSRHHAAFVCSEGQVLLEDLGSHNGTRVNGAAVTAPCRLAPGDQINVADVVLHFGPPATGGSTLTYSQVADSASVAISWDEVRPPSDEGRKKRSQLFRCLANAGDLLTVPRPPEDLFEPILDLVESAIQPERAFLLLCDGEDDEPVIRASRLSGRDDHNVTLSQTMVARVLEEKTSFLLEDDTAADLAGQHSIIYQGIRSAMATPLFDNQNVIGLLYADTTDRERRYTRDELVAFSLLANVIAVALTHARYDSMEREKHRLDTELDAARSIMHDIMPDELPTLSGYEVMAHSEPCFEVGGDLYDICPLPDGRVALIVGDVSGKGLGAALLVSSLVPLLRAMLEIDTDLCKVIANLNRQLYRTTDPIRHCTLFVGLLDPDSGRLEYVNAGHNLPYILRRQGNVQSAASTGLPIALIETGQWHCAELTLEPGDLLALYSDGIPETWQGEEEEYGEARFKAQLVEHRDRSVGDICTAALNDVTEFRGDTPVGDDVTLLVVRRST